MDKRAFALPPWPGEVPRWVDFTDPLAPSLDLNLAEALAAVLNKKHRKNATNAEGVSSNEIDFTPAAVLAFGQLRQLARISSTDRGALRRETPSFTVGSADTTG